MPTTNTPSLNLEGFRWSTQLAFTLYWSPTDILSLRLLPSLTGGQKKLLWEAPLFLAQGLAQGCKGSTFCSRASSKAIKIQSTSTMGLGKEREGRGAVERDRRRTLNSTRNTFPFAHGKWTVSSPSGQYGPGEPRWEEWEVFLVSLTTGEAKEPPGAMTPGRTHRAFQGHVAMLTHEELKELTRKSQRTKIGISPKKIYTWPTSTFKDHSPWQKCKQKPWEYSNIIFLIEYSNFWQGCEKSASLSTVGENVKWYCCYGKQYGSSPKNCHTTLRLPYKPAIPLLKAGSWRDICTLVFTRALFTIAKGGHNPSAHRWMNE